MTTPSEKAASVRVETMRHIGGRAGDWCNSTEAPARCDSCSERAWCSLTSWREAGAVVSKFLCDTCRQTIPNDERGWGRDV